MFTMSWTKAESMFLKCRVEPKLDVITLNARMWLQKRSGQPEITGPHLQDGMTKKKKKGKRPIFMIKSLLQSTECVTGLISVKNLKSIKLHFILRFNMI